MFGFRYRLLLLFLPLVLIYFFYKKIKPSIRLLFSLIFFVISFDLFKFREYGRDDYNLFKAFSKTDQSVLNSY